MTTRGHHGLLMTGAGVPPVTSDKLIALGTVSGPAHRFSASLDSSAWSSAIAPTGATDFGTILGLASGRLILPHGTTTRYSDDDGANWSTVSNPASQFAQGKPILTDAGTILVSVTGNNGLLRSTNSGTSYSRVGTGKSSARIGYRPGLTVSLADTSAPMNSANDGSTWSALGARLDTMAAAFSPSSPKGIGVGTRIIFGGQMWGGPFGVSAFIPALARTTNGTTWDFYPVSLLPSGYVAALAYNGSRIVSALNDGSLHRSDDSGQTSTPCTSTMAAIPTCGEWDGAHFVFGADSGLIVGSSDGDTFAARTQPLNVSVLDLTVIP